MADKKLIDNSSATTVDNFYGNKSGADVQIPLATAAAVLAGASRVYERISPSEAGTFKMAKLTVGNYVVSVIDMGYSCVLAIAIYQSGYCDIKALSAINDVSDRFSIVYEDSVPFLCITLSSARAGIQYRVIKL